MSAARHSKAIFIEVGAGELLDKVTILSIKADKISEPAKLANIRREMEALAPVRAELISEYDGVLALEAQLREVNEALWAIEDDIRECESRKDFGELFIKLARSVYMQNDKRAELKKKINVMCEADIVEEKSYRKF
jgi:Family of unknown function (DUF6165)